MKFSNYKDAAKEYGVGGGDWMNLEDGDNKVRIVSEFESYGSHYDSETKKSTICIGKENCELCKKGLKPRVQFLGWVIDRKDNQVKLLRIGYKIFQQIGDFQKNDEYAFDSIPDYDVTINRTGQALETEYKVIPARNNTELTEQEKEAISEKVKDPEIIIEDMKAKVVYSETVENESKEKIETKVEVEGKTPQEKVKETAEKIKENSKPKDDIDVKDIPF